MSFTTIAILLIIVVMALLVVLVIGIFNWLNNLEERVIELENASNGVIKKP